MKAAPRLGRLVVTALTLAACGGADAARNPPVATTRSSDAANLAQQAAEPRTADPTANTPTGLLPPTKGAAAAPAAPPVSSAPSSAPAAPASTTPTKTPSDPPARIGARHVLIQWMGSERAAQSVVRSREQARSVAEEVLKRARSKEDFARLAVEYSDEPGAASRGGSLGRFGHGQMVGAFEAAAFKLEVGEISDIIETPFGFHIIQRTE